MSLAEQIINDFRTCQLLKESTPEKVAARSKILSNLLIDNVLRRAEFLKFYNDLQGSQEDFHMVIQLCKEYPQGNERVMGSAYFNLG